MLDEWAARISMWAARISICSRNPTTGTGCQFDAIHKCSKNKNGKETKKSKQRLNKLESVGHKKNSFLASTPIRMDATADTTTEKLHTQTISKWKQCIPATRTLRTDTIKPPGRKRTELAKTQEIGGHRLHAVVGINAFTIPQIKALGKQIQEQHPGTRRSRN